MASPQLPGKPSSPDKSRLPVSGGYPPKDGGGGVVLIIFIILVTILIIILTQYGHSITTLGISYEGFGKILALILVAFGLVIPFLLGFYQPRRTAQKTKKEYPKLSIVAIIAYRRSIQLIRSNVILLILMITYMTTVHFREEFHSPIVSLMLLLFFITVNIREWIFHYRLGKGIYGSTERESREIIQFMLNNSETIDFTDKGTPKKIMSKEDLEEIKLAINEVLHPVVPNN